MQQRESVVPASHWQASLERLATPPEFPGKQDIYTGGSYDPKDEDYVWSTAVNIKAKIDALRSDSALSKEKRRGLQHAALISNPLTSGSYWTKEMMVAVQIYFVPQADWNAIIPQQYIRSRGQLVQSIKEDVFNTNHDESFLKDVDQIRSVGAGPMSSFYSAIHAILRTVIDEKGEDDDIVKRDKVEAYSDALFRKTIELLGVNDICRSPLHLCENHRVRAEMRHYPFEVTNEFAVMRCKDFRRKNLLLAFIENKKFVRQLNPFPQFLAQKAAESLCCALTTYALGAEGSQEVFGISVRHRYFSFWHAVFPQAYLEQANKDITYLSHEDFVQLKCYPVSEFGLDICDPAERLLIFQAINAICEYVEAGPRIGSYKE